MTVSARRGIPQTWEARDLFDNPYACVWLGMLPLVVWCLARWVTPQQALLSPALDAVVNAGFLVFWWGKAVSEALREGSKEERRHGQRRRR